MGELKIEFATHDYQTIGVGAVSHSGLFSTVTIEQADEGMHV